MTVIVRQNYTCKPNINFLIVLVDIYLMNRYRLQIYTRTRDFTDYVEYIPYTLFVQELRIYNKNLEKGAQD